MKLITAILALILLITAPARAAMILSASRSVTLTGETSLTSTKPTGWVEQELTHLHTASSSRTYSDTYLSPMPWHGWAEVVTTDASTVGTAVLYARFQVDVPERYSLQGNLQELGTGATTFMRLTGPGLNFYRDSPAPSEDFYTAGILAPGVYEIEYSTTATGNSLSYAIFYFSSVPTPEPASVCILGAGIIGVMIWRKRGA